MLSRYVRQGIRILLNACQVVTCDEAFSTHVGPIIRDIIMLGKSPMAKILFERIYNFGISYIYTKV